MSSWFINNKLLLNVIIWSWFINNKLLLNVIISSWFINKKLLLNVIISSWFINNKLLLNAIISSWSINKKLLSNVAKTRHMLFTLKPTQVSNVTIMGNVVENVNHTKYLSVHIDSKLNWREHINQVCKKLTRNFSTQSWM